jgi:hypothetical protein
MKFRKFDSSRYLVRQYQTPQGLASVSLVEYTLPNTESQLWYENRDGFHANFHGFDNTIEVREGFTGFGISLNEIYRNGIVLSNSSTASAPSEESGSNTRVPDNSFNWYTIREAWQAGLIQFFPEYRDYDGSDWFKINQPYVFTTQGSSGSEKEEVEKARQLINALRPEVRQHLIENNRVGDVVAYLMRCNQTTGYLNPISHRVVVDMQPSNVEVAQSITLDTLPPKLSIKVISDSITNSTILITDEVIGLKRTEYQPIRTIVVEVASDKACDIHWLKAQGDCTITFQNPEKTRATITIPFQINFPVVSQSNHTLVSNRVEVIAIADDGTHYSSPVFLTEYFTPEARNQMPKSNEILVYGDDSFVCRVNGTEVMRGSAWNVPVSCHVAWTGSDVVEIEVHNVNGAGGLLAGLWVGDVYLPTDNSWECSLNRSNWVPPVEIAHAGSNWQRYGLSHLGLPGTNHKWLWHPNAGENTTVYFRKTIGAVVPDPTPTPQPVVGDFERRIKALEEIVSKLRAALT